MHLGKSVAHTLELADRALRLITELAPAIGARWEELRVEAGEELETYDVAATCARICRAMRSLQGQLLVAAITAELEPGPLSLKTVRRFQRRLSEHFDRVRGLLALSGFQDEADSLNPRRNYFRRIRWLARRDPEPAATAASPGLLQKMLSIEPQALIEANLGLMAIAGFPHRPSSPQQQRRKRRRRRRANPGAPTGSCRPDRGDPDDD